MTSPWFSGLFSQVGGKYTSNSFGLKTTATITSVSSVSQFTLIYWPLSAADGTSIEQKAALSCLFSLLLIFSLKGEGKTLLNTWKETLTIDITLLMHNLSGSVTVQTSERCIFSSGINDVVSTAIDSTATVDLKLNDFKPS